MLLCPTSLNARKWMSKARGSAHKIAMLSLSALLCVFGQAFLLKAVAADDNNSMDSIWVDPAVRNKVEQSAADTSSSEPTDVSGSNSNSKKNAQEKADTGSQLPKASQPETSNAPGKPAQGDSTGSTSSAPVPSGGSGGSADTVARASSGSSLDLAAPMCTVREFKDSPIITGSGWAAMGPFKSTGTNEFVDDRNNKVTLDVSDDHICHAELTISAYDANRDPMINLLNMQMYVDFFLESLGIKANSIQSINVQLERNRDALLTDAQPLNITGGRYSVVINKNQSANGHSTDYVVAVNSMDTNKKVKQPFVSSKPSEEAGSPLRLSMMPPDTEEKPVALSREQLKEQFTDLIGKWQKIKKQAVRTKQANALSTVLSGNALSVQSRAVAYLVTHKCYYDINPKGVTVEQVTEIMPGKKYMVAAEVKEAIKFVDEASGKVIRDTDGANRVSYTIEKSGDRWVITDSKVLSRPSSASTSTAH